ncbi:hypothetical protein ABZP36_016169 [Zizania latifolia]
MSPNQFRARAEAEPPPFRGERPATRTWWKIKELSPPMHAGRFEAFSALYPKCGGKKFGEERQQIANSEDFFGFLPYVFGVDPTSPSKSGVADGGDDTADRGDDTADRGNVAGEARRCGLRRREAERCWRGLGGVASESGVNADARPSDLPGHGATVGHAALLVLR